MRSAARRHTERRREQQKCHTNVFEYHDFPFFDCLNEWLSKLTGRKRGQIRRAMSVMAEDRHQQPNHKYPSDEVDEWRRGFAAAAR